jgi:putative MATE family efflux protein
MKNLTQGSITSHIASMAVPMAAGMIFQTLYYFVDLYFVAKLGEASLAGVSAAGNANFVIFALTQSLGVGTASLISHAVGRADQAESDRLFNQALLLSGLFGAATLLASYTLSSSYMQAVTADAAAMQEGTRYLQWFGPGLAMQFPMVAMGSALRGTGIVKPTMVVQVSTLLLNALLAPVFIAGWGTDYPLGVAGAGLASSVAIAAGVVMLTVYFVRSQSYVSVQRSELRPRFGVCKRILAVGVPAGGEFALIFLYNATTYWAIRSFGSAAQAGFGVGSRVMQGLFVPALAIAFAAAPIVGQNFGARQARRVRETFYWTAVITSVLMLALTTLCQWNPEVLVQAFTQDPDVTRVGALFLRLLSWNFVAQGLVFTCSNVFQGLGNTVPSIVSSAIRLIAYALPAIWLSTQSFFRLEHLWQWSIATAWLQACASVLLLRHQFRARIAPLEEALPAEPLEPKLV